MSFYPKKCVKALFRYLGLEIRRLSSVQQEQQKQADWMGLQGEGNKWLKKFDIRSVFDIGANTGAFTRMIARILPEAMIYAFEPLADCFDAMNASMRQHKKFKSFNVALGDAEMETNIYRSESSLSSSCLEMEALHKVNAPHTAAASLEKIKVKRLNDVIKDLKIEDNILIKIDTQGYEDRVILGGLNLIRRAKIMIVETSFYELYKSQPLFDAIYDLLTKEGFLYMGSLEQWRSPIDGSILQEDSLFIREPWDSLKNIGR